MGCGGIFNALAVLSNLPTRDSLRAQHVLADFVLEASVPFLPFEFNAAIAAIDHPLPELLHALAERAAELPDEAMAQPAEGAVQDQHTALLLGAAAAAAQHTKKVAAEVGGAKPAPEARRIGKLVADNLAAAHREEAHKWRRL
eukprot:2515402-Prymnesium_polylepis.1